MKSLVPFPQVMAMMNANLDWMQQVGYAFADQQAAVLDSVQRLRRQAQDKGHLQSTPQQVVGLEEDAITIAPAQPDVVYVPSYNPADVYGEWPYPSYPPVYLPPPAGYVVGTALAMGLAFGAGVAVTAGLWNWARPAWGSGYVNVNVNRYNNINVNRAAVHSNVWQANRAGGRPAGLARAPVGPVGAPARRGGLPAGAIGRQQVSVPRSAVTLPSRASGAAGGAVNRPGGGQVANRANLANRPAVSNRPNLPNARNCPNIPGASGQFSRPASSNFSRPQGAFSGMGEGRQAAQFGQRGAQSRSFGQLPHTGGGGVGGRGGGGGGHAARGGGGGRFHR